MQQTIEKIKFTREILLTAQSRQKSYGDHRRRPPKFEEGDQIFLRVTLTTKIGKALKSKKLNPKFISPFQILKRVGPVAYQITLPSKLSNLHNVFHMSQLRKYCFDPSHIIEYKMMKVKDDLIYETTPVQIMDRSVKHLGYVWWRKEIGRKEVERKEVEWKEIELIYIFHRYVWMKGK